MASLALTGASLWRAMSMRDRPAGCASCATRLCGALCGSGRPPLGGRRRSFVGGERAMVGVPRIAIPRSTNLVTNASARKLNCPRVPRCLDHYFGQLNADRLSGALSICRTQQSVQFAYPTSRTKDARWQRSICAGVRFGWLIVAVATFFVAWFSPLFRVKAVSVPGGGSKPEMHAALG